MITKNEREPLAKDAICSAFHCPLGVIAEFDNWEESGWMFVVAATRYWATNHLVRSLVLNHPQLVKSLVQFCQLCKLTPQLSCQRCLWQTTLAENISCTPPVAAGLLWFIKLESTPDGATWVNVTISAFQWSYGSLLYNVWEPRSSWYYVRWTTKTRNSLKKIVHCHLATVIVTNLSRTSALADENEFFLWLFYTLNMW